MSKKRQSQPFSFKHQTSISIESHFANLAKKGIKHIKALDLSRIGGSNVKFQRVILKQLKSLHSLKYQFLNKKIFLLLLNKIKSVKDVEIPEPYYSPQYLRKAILNMSNLQTFNEAFQTQSPLLAFRYARKVSSLRFSFVKTMMARVAPDTTKMITEHGYHLKTSNLKSLKIEVAKAGPNDMNSFAELLPKGASLYLKVNVLPLTFIRNEFDPVLSKKIAGLHVKSLTNSFLYSLVDSSKYLTGLTELHLGNSSTGVLELNQHSNYSLLPRLAEFSSLESFSIHLKLENPFPIEKIASLNQIKFPTSLKRFSLNIDQIPLGPEGWPIEKFAEIFKQITDMKELTALKLRFGFISGNEGELNGIFSHLSPGLAKLKTLHLDISANGVFYLTKLFDWKKTFPQLENLELSVPFVNYFDIDKKPFSFDFKNLRTLSLTISRELVLKQDNFECLIELLIKQDQLKYLTFKLTNSFDFVKTIDILKKYLANDSNLRLLTIKFENTQETREQSFYLSKNGTKLE